MANIRTWSQIMDQALPDYSTTTNCGASIFFIMKSNLTTAGWVLTGSSNGNPASGAGMDGVDRIGTVFDPTMFVWNTNGSNHTWFVMRHPTLGYSFMFSCYGANAANPIWAKTEFTGGTVTNDPTSPDAIGLASSQFVTSAVLHRVSMLYNTFGEFLFISISSGTGSAEWACGLFQVVDASTSPLDPWPMVALWSYNASVSLGNWGALGISQLVQPTTWACKTGSGLNCNSVGSVYSGPFTQYAYDGSIGGYFYNAMNQAGGTTRGSFIAEPLKIWIWDQGNTYHQNTDYKGALADIEFCYNEPLGQGFVYGVPASRVKIGSLWLPFTVSPSFT